MKNESLVCSLSTAKAEMMMTLCGMKVERKDHGQRVKGIVKDYVCSVIVVSRHHAEATKYAEHKAYVKRT
jgi:hypothetical protein